VPSYDVENYPIELCRQNLNIRTTETGVLSTSTCKCYLNNHQIGDWRPGVQNERTKMY